MFILFDHETIESSNLRTAVIEILIAGTAAYFLAKYFFRKEMDMKNREINVEKQKIENDFQYYLRNAHVDSWWLSTSKKEISKNELQKLGTRLYHVIESHKVFRPTNMEIRMLLENCEKLTQKWITGDMDLNNPLLIEDMKIIAVNLAKVGRKYNFDLSIA